MTDKTDGAFRTIGEMARELSVKPHILRYWEEQFPMLQPLKRAGGRRFYRREDVQLLHRIRSLLSNEGYTIRGARRLLQSGLAAPPESAPAPASVAEQLPFDSPPAALAGDMGAAIRAVRDRLARALAAS